MPEANPTPMLSYGVKPRKRRWRRAALLAALVIVVGAAIRWRTMIIDRATHFYWQHRVETFTYPKGTVVCEAFIPHQSPATRGWSTPLELIQSGNYMPIVTDYIGVSISDIPNSAGLKVPDVEKYSPTLIMLREFDLGPSLELGLLFVGSRTSANGCKRIVLLTENLHIYLDDYSIKLWCETVEPERWGRRENLSARPPLYAYGPTIPIEGAFRAFGGQRDPNDSSRFTVDYETATEKGAIVGVLQDDGSVMFSIIKR